MLWWHVSGSDCSTAEFFVRFTFQEKIKSIHNHDTVIMWVGLLITWLQIDIAVMSK